MTIKYKWANADQTSVNDREGNRSIPVLRRLFRSEVQPWIDAGNEIEAFETPEEIAARETAEAAQAKKAADTAVKLEGVEFEGVMCSATKEDFWGLASVKPWIAGGQSVPFHFDNGSVLLITPENIEAFEAVWPPFRASFFEV